MKTVTLVAYKRPLYTANSLLQLSKCRCLERFDRLDVFIDPGYDEVAEVSKEWSARMPISTEVHVNEDRLGVAWNPFRAYSTVFEQLGSDFNVAIEDDSQLSPDALQLALWFFEKHGASGRRYKFLNLCDHYQYRGPGKNRNDVPEDPALLAETSNISAPFAWCLPRRAWPFVKRHWNKNRLSNLGWDWSIRFGMRMEGAVALTPVLSRCQNIGRLDGTHEDGTTFDIQLGLNYSDGSYSGDYRIVNPLSDHELRSVEPWMVAEIPRYFSELPKDACFPPSTID